MGLAPKKAGLVLASRLASRYPRQMTQFAPPEDDSPFTQTLRATLVAAPALLLGHGGLLVMVTVASRVVGFSALWQLLTLIGAVSFSVLWRWALRSRFGNAWFATAISLICCLVVVFGLTAALSFQSVAVGETNLLQVLISYVLWCGSALLGVVAGQFVGLATR